VRKKKSIFLLALVLLLSVMVIAGGVAGANNVNKPEKAPQENVVDTSKIKKPVEKGVFDKENNIKTKKMVMRGKNVTIERKLTEEEIGKRSFETDQISTNETHQYYYYGGPDFAAGLLWDERNNDLDLHLTAPDGTIRSSIDVNTLTEECQLYNGTGWWLIEVVGYNVPNGPQTYYLGIDVE